MLKSTTMDLVCGRYRARSDFTLSTKSHRVPFNPFPNRPLFSCVCNRSIRLFENTVGKGEIVLNEQFLFFPCVFYPFGKLSAIFIKSKIVI